MIIVKDANSIITSNTLAVVRRTLFTATKPAERSTTSFDFETFYQQGTAIVLQSHGTVYLLTPSHVVRNATKNDYQNDSPVWVPVRHGQATHLADFLMPMRFHDLSPAGETALDAAVLEINPLIIGGLPDFLDWDNGDLFCQPDDLILGCTAAVAGYPEEVNPYEFVDQEDGTVVQVPTVRLATFLGVVSSEPDGQLMFENSMHQSAYQYAGLSGGVVVCSIGGKLKYLGMAISYGHEGRRFKIIKFSDIRCALGDLRSVPWEVVDEAYFLGHPTHSMMTFREFEDDFAGRAPFAQRRSNVFLEQLVRTMKAEPRHHWVCDFAGMHDELRARLQYELLGCLKAVAKIRTSGGPEPQKFTRPYIDSALTTQTETSAC